MSTGRVRHRLAIDLQEPFQLASSRGGVSRRHWDRFPSRLEGNAQAALRLLECHGARATFFVDGWIGSRHGPVLAEIARQGHEVACRLDDTVIQPEADRQRLEAAAGRVVHGCAVASGVAADRIGTRIAGAGFRYVQGRLAPWMPNGPSSIHVLPPADVSGEWLRLLPAAAIPGLLGRFARAGAPRTFAFRLWELDPEAERLAVLSAVEAVRAYRNLPLFGNRLERLLQCAPFEALRDGLGLTEERVARPAPRPVEIRRPPVGTAQGEPVTVVVPCFNEAPGLAFLANALRALGDGLGRHHPLHVVLVDDGSSDGTWVAMTQLFGADPRVRLIRHDRNRGVGAAIMTGIDAAETEVVAVIDSDCSYDPALIEEMLPLLEPDVALVTASPYHPRGGVEGVPRWRLVLSRGASWLYRRLLRNKLATYTSCFRVGRRSALRAVELRHEGYIGVVEMLARLDLEGWRIVEHPVVLEARLLGQSKIRIVRVIAGHLRFAGEILITRGAAGRRGPASKLPVRG